MSLGDEIGYYQFNISICTFREIEIFLVFQVLDLHQFAPQARLYKV